MHAVQVKCPKPCGGSYAVLYCYMMEILFSATLFLNLGNGAHTCMHMCTPICKEHSYVLQIHTCNRQKMLEMKVLMQPVMHNYNSL